MRATITLILCALAIFRPAMAAGEIDTVNRILRVFDFEERHLGNPEQLPMHWAKVEGPGLPHYVNGRLSTDRARSGEYSFRFDLNGGGLIYRYDPARIPVQQGAHYRVEGFVQTTHLAHARARITATFVDIDLRPIASTIRHSRLYAGPAESPRTPGEPQPWQRLSVELSADMPEAAYLVVELGLLQPMHYAPTTLGQRTLFNQDIRGSAWFDDVTVAQVPRVRLSTDRPGNIFRRGDPMQLQVHVSDRFTEDLAAQLMIRDAAGQTVFQRSGALDMAAAEAMGPGQRRMTLLLPELRPGWYQANLVMTSRGQLVGSQELDLVLLADHAAGGRTDDRIGIIATELPFDGWDELPDILPFLGAGRVKLAVWSEAGDVQKVDSAAFDLLLERLAESGITPTACLIDLPPELVREQQDDPWQNADQHRIAASSPSSSWLHLLRTPPEQWQPSLAHLISRHAGHLDRWQLGADGSDAFVTQPAMREVYGMVYEQFAALVRRPDLAMPWPAWHELRGQVPATVALSVPPSVLPNQLPLYMQDIRQHDAQNLSLSLELLDREQYGREAQIRDLAQRVIYALSAGAERIDIPLPFTVRRDGETVVKQPQELLMVIRTLSLTLGGATYQGKVPIAEGVEAFLFERNGQGILAMWDRGNEAGMKDLALNLGANPMQVDLWGNVTPFHSSRDRLDPGSGQVSLQVGPMPIFLVDIDGRLARLRASVTFDRPLIESSFRPHTRRLRFVNPYRRAIAGTLRLRPPAGWTINPPSLVFNLNPGETFDREITIEFPYNSFAGHRTIRAEFTLQGERNLTFTIPLTLTLGLSDVGMQSLALREGNDVIVQQIISNYGDEPIDYTAFAIYPGQAREERLVTNLAPGRTTIRLYRFTNVPITPGAAVRVGLKELTGTRILNDEVEIQ